MELCVTLVHMQGQLVLSWSCQRGRPSRHPPAGPAEFSRWWAPPHSPAASGSSCPGSSSVGYSGRAEPQWVTAGTPCRQSWGGHQMTSSLGPGTWWSQSSLLIWSWTLTGLSDWGWSLEKERRNLWHSWCADTKLGVNHIPNVLVDAGFRAGWPKKVTTHRWIKTLPLPWPHVTSNMLVLITYRR